MALFTTGTRVEVRIGGVWVAGVVIDMPDRSAVRIDISGAVRVFKSQTVRLSRKAAH